MRHLIAVLLAAVFLSPACRVSHKPVDVLTRPPSAAQPPSPGQPAEGDGPIVWHPVQSARWDVPLSGLLNLDDPHAAEVRDHEVSDHKVTIVLLAHVLVHPTAGTFLVDTGMSRSPDGAGRGIARAVVSQIEVVEPLADALAPHPPLAGAVLTHMHIDHVLGLPDVPAEVPVFIGPNEQELRKGQHALLRRTYRALLRGRDRLNELSFPDSLGGMPAVDLVGDGSIWVLSTPGHTPGSVSVVARTTEGPVLLTGDTCHTQWGWDNGVTPGAYTDDHALNQQSLDRLRALAEATPGMRVQVGHEVLGADMVTARMGAGAQNQ